jgi:hypothetical protein
MKSKSLRQSTSITLRLLLMGGITLLTACSYTAPYRRVATAQSLGLSPEQKVIVTISEVEHRPGQRKPFFTDTKRVLADLPNHEGLVGYSFRFQIFGAKAWTMTAWKDQASRDDFVLSPLYYAAMRNSRVTAQKMKFLTIETSLKDLPLAWKDALQRLESAKEASPR